MEKNNLEPSIIAEAGSQLSSIRLNPPGGVKHWNKPDWLLWWWYYVCVWWCIPEQWWCVVCVWWGKLLPIYEEWETAFDSAISCLLVCACLLWPIIPRPVFFQERKNISIICQWVLGRQPTYIQLDVLEVGVVTICEHIIPSASLVLCPMLGSLLICVQMKKNFVIDVTYSHSVYYYPRRPVPCILNLLCLAPSVVETSNKSAYPIWPLSQWSWWQSPRQRQGFLTLAVIDLLWFNIIDLFSILILMIVT